MLGLSFGWRLFWFGVAWALGFWSLIKTLQVGNLVGPIEWAETHMGSGGTYNFVKLAGIFLIIVGVVVLFKG